ncbi:hypothetical protein F5141DRAFT_1060341 [Pisolithus sp. B1]|nr:hypothetical protein F5141DRAFT_1060341 [Pisolithus sp. B1]
MVHLDGTSWAVCCTYNVTRLTASFDIEASGACRKVALTIRSEEGGPSCAKIVKVNLKGAGNGPESNPPIWRSPQKGAGGRDIVFPAATAVLLSSATVRWTGFCRSLRPWGDKAAAILGSPICLHVKVVPPEPWLDNAGERERTTRSLCYLCCTPAKVPEFRKSDNAVFKKCPGRSFRSTLAGITLASMVTAPFVSLKPLRLSKAGTFCSGNLWLLYCYAQDLSPNRVGDNMPLRLAGSGATIFIWELGGMAVHLSDEFQSCLRDESVSALIRGQACLGRNAAEYFDASSLNLWSCHLSTTVLLGYEFKALTPLRSFHTTDHGAPHLRYARLPSGGVAQATFAKCAKTRSKVLTLLDPADRSSSGSATSCRFKYSEPLLLCIKPFLDSLHGGEEYLTVGMVVDTEVGILLKATTPVKPGVEVGLQAGASAHLRGRTFRFFSFAAVKLVDSRITGNPMLHYSSSGNTPQDLIMYHAHSYSLRVVAVILRSLMVTAGYGGRNLAC